MIRCTQLNFIEYQIRCIIRLAYPKVLDIDDEFDVIMILQELNNLPGKPVSNIYEFNIDQVCEIINNNRYTEVD